MKNQHYFVLAKAPDGKNSPILRLKIHIVFKGGKLDFD